MPDTVFFAHWGVCCSGIQDTITVLRSKVDKLRDVLLRFNKAVLPVTISWDVSVLRSDSLPFPDQSPAPRAQGELWVSEYTTGCPLELPVLITDSATYGDCLRKDSVFLSNFLYSAIGNATFSIGSWRGIGGSVSIKEQNKTIKSTFYLNPLTQSSVLKVEKIGILSTKNIILKVTDMLGKRIAIPYRLTTKTNEISIKIQIEVYIFINY